MLQTEETENIAMMCNTNPSDSKVLPLSKNHHIEKTRTILLVILGVLLVRVSIYVVYINLIYKYFRFSIWLV